MASNPTEEITPALIFHSARQRQSESYLPSPNGRERFPVQREKATLKAWPSHFQI